ncbi:holin [Allokutzneria sp. A3M-2-11 16]|uniref:holin n=1 Tax=Allokutzneria sp. A3M-2-11 16 TaxID=2962043 RepID=UPI0020B8FD62|nr:holin [Allokutzneria sp. A3M-2-11 16]MCP3800207.1 holin [Allokutzneria sp. A3M-2-11 16]
MWTALFWLAAFERAVKTFAQTAAATLGASTVGILDAPWTAALSVAGMAAVLSVLTSVASIKTGDTGTPSAVKASADPR